MNNEELIEYAIRTSMAIKGEIKPILIDYFYKQREVIDKAKKKLKQGITFCENDSEGAYDICNIAINREKEILNVLMESDSNEEKNA